VSREPWQAPRTGYLLTAAVAAANVAEADQLWDELDHDAQVDVLTALGAQARLAVSTSLAPGRYEGFSRDFATEACSVAHDAFNALVSDEPWAVPECSHCRRWLASTLCSMSVQLARHRGMSAEVFAHECRETAERAART
jgi:hypothetical protein